MLNQDVVLALLQASITGAGLVLAVYALIIPLSKRLFEHKLIDFFNISYYLRCALDDFYRGKLSTQTAKEARDKVINFLQALNYPTYLRYGVGVTFFGYVLTLMFCTAWVVDWEKTSMDSLIIPTFFLTTLVFLIVGVASVKDTHKIMSEDFEQLLKSLRKDEDQT